MQPHFTGTALITDDVPALAAFYAAVLDAGVEGSDTCARATVSGAVLSFFSGRRSVWLRDPDGNIVTSTRRGETGGKPSVSLNANPQVSTGAAQAQAVTGTNELSCRNRSVPFDRSTRSS